MNIEKLLELTVSWRSQDTGMSWHAVQKSDRLFLAINDREMLDMLSTSIDLYILRAMRFAALHQFKDLNESHVRAFMEQEGLI